MTVRERSDVRQEPSKAEKRVCVLLAEGDRLLTALVRRWAEAENGFEIVDVVTGDAATIAAVGEIDPDLLVLALGSGGLDGPGILRHLAARGAVPFTLVLSSRHDDDQMVEVIRAGARGYLAKPDIEKWFDAAIRTVAEGEAWLDRRSAARVIDALHLCVKQQRFHAPPPVALTPSQQSVLVRIARGQTNRQIGDELQMSPHTVKAHVSALLRQLGLKNRVEAALYGERVGLATLSDEPPLRGSS